MINNNSNDNRNLILALVLMTAVWFGFSLLFPTKPPAPVVEAKPAAVTSPATSAPSPSPAAIAPLQQPPSGHTVGAGARDRQSRRPTTGRCSPAPGPAWWLLS